MAAHFALRVPCYPQGGTQAPIKTHATKLNLFSNQRSPPSTPAWSGSFRGMEVNYGIKLRVVSTIDIDQPLTHTRKM